MRCKGKTVTFSKHLYKRLKRVRDLDRVKHVLLNGKHSPLGKKNMFRAVSGDVEVRYKENPYRIKVVTVIRRKK